MSWINVSNARKNSFFCGSYILVGGRERIGSDWHGTHDCGCSIGTWVLFGIGESVVNRSIQSRWYEASLELRCNIYSPGQDKSLRLLFSC